MSTPTALYRLFGADTLVYLGISKSFGRRWHEHAQEQDWWPEVRRQTIDWHPSREAALAAEEAAIKAEHPRVNKQHVVLGTQRRRPARPPGPTAIASGARIREFRTERGLTQAAVAAGMTAVGGSWHQSTVNRVETGRQVILLAEIEHLAAVFGVDRGWLCNDLADCVPAYLEKLQGAA